MMMRELHEVATGVSVEEAERQNYLQTVQELHQFEYKRLLRMHTRLFMTTFTQRSMKKWSGHGLTSLTGSYGPVHTSETADKPCQGPISVCSA